MRTKTVKFGDFDVVFIQMPSKIWITPTRTIELCWGIRQMVKLSDHISGKWSDEFEKDDKVVLDAYTSLRFGSTFRISRRVQQLDELPPLKGVIRHLEEQVRSRREVPRRADCSDPRCRTNQRGTNDREDRDQGCHRCPRRRRRPHPRPAPRKSAPVVNKAASRLQGKAAHSGTSRRREIPLSTH